MKHLCMCVATLAMGVFTIANAEAQSVDWKAEYRKNGFVDFETERRDSGFNSLHDFVRYGRAILKSNLADANGKYNATIPVDRPQFQPAVIEAEPTPLPHSNDRYVPVVPVGTCRPTARRVGCLPLNPQSETCNRPVHWQ
ncbi:MAG: hypothetical protein FWE95_08750 [Planctomycetaceae bacterium]|nr:hypothetical protein [Planctomycetaceae bacterium]